MGGGTKSVDSAGAAQAKQTSQAAQQQEMAIAADQNAKQSQLYKMLFGDNGSGGSLSQFLDPNSLNVTKPTGVYERQYQEGVQTAENDAKNQRASQARSMASRGFGGAPTGFGASQDLKARLATADAKGSAYTSAVGKQYQDALSNFWNATGTASDTMRGATGAALQGNSSAGNQATSMYNAGNQQVQKSGLLGNVIGGAAQVGAAAMCPAKGAQIMLADGSMLAVETLRKGMNLRGIDGEPCVLLDDPIPSLADTVRVKSASREGECSTNHTLALVNGGYEYAANASGKTVLVIDGSESVSVTCSGKEVVYFLPIGGSHSYCADGFWALA